MAVYWFLDFFSRVSSRLCPLARAAGGGALDAELLASPPKGDKTPCCHLNFLLGIKFRNKNAL